MPSGQAKKRKCSGKQRKTPTKRAARGWNETLRQLSKSSNQSESDIENEIDSEGDLDINVQITPEEHSTQADPDTYIPQNKTSEDSTNRTNSGSESGTIYN